MNEARKPPGEAVVWAVDDQPELLDAYATMLELEGFVVRRFNRPKDVLEAIAAGETLPSLLVTDLQMPSMSLGSATAGGVGDGFGGSATAWASNVNFWRSTSVAAKSSSSGRGIG